MLRNILGKGCLLVLFMVMVLLVGCKEKSSINGNQNANLLDDVSGDGKERLSDQQEDGLVETIDGVDYSAYVEEEIGISSDDRILCNNGVLKVFDYEIGEQGLTIRLKTLSDKKTWIDDGESWSLEESMNFRFLSYAPDGTLYGIIYQNNDGSNLESESSEMTDRLCRFMGNGVIEEVELEGLSKPMTKEQEELREYEITGDVFTYISSFLIFEDNTALICYANNVNKLYDLESGTVLGSFESELGYMIAARNVVVMGDDVVFASNVVQNMDFKLNYICKKDGRLTKTSSYNKDEMGLGKVSIAKGEGDDIYILSEKGLFLASWDSNKIKKLRDIDKMDKGKDDFYDMFCFGVNNDFYVLVYEGGLNEGEDGLKRLYHYY